MKCSRWDYRLSQQQQHKQKQQHVKLVPKSNLYFVEKLELIIGVVYNGYFYRKPNSQNDILCTTKILNSNNGIHGSE